MRSIPLMRASAPDCISATLPASHRVLSIPELLDIIFNFLGRNSNVRNACVCKRWSDIALDVVWKEVDDLLDLFRLLKPIRHHQEDALEYVSGSVRQSGSRLILSDSALRHSQKPATGPGLKSMPSAFAP